MITHFKVSSTSNFAPTPLLCNICIVTNNFSHFRFIYILVLHHVQYIVDTCLLKGLKQILIFVSTQFFGGILLRKFYQIRILIT